MARPWAVSWNGRSRLVILARLRGDGCTEARETALPRKLRHVPVPLRKTLTYDRGKEMAEHERLAQRLAIRVFFADPHSPWQRGTNENTMACCGSICRGGRTCRATPSVN